MSKTATTAKPPTTATSTVDSVNVKKVTKQAKTAPSSKAKGRIQPVTSTKRNKVQQKPAAKKAPAKRPAQVKRTTVSKKAAQAPKAIARPVFARASDLPPAQVTVTDLTPAAQPIPAEKPAKPLTAHQAAFAREYPLDDNATRAYMRATGNPNVRTAGAEGHKYLKNPEIWAQIEVERKLLADRAGMSNAQLVSHIVDMVRADPRELVEWHVDSCRYCHGLDHRYQRTENEYARDFAYWQTSGKLPARLRNRLKREGEDLPEDWDSEGGTGYDCRQPPHRDCPECMGRGHGKMIVNDTRLLSPAAAKLYAGIQETKDGLAIKLNSQMEAIEKLGRILGVFKEDNKQKTPTDPFAELLARISGPKAALGINPDPHA